MRCSSRLLYSRQPARCDAYAESGCTELVQLVGDMGGRAEVLLGPGTPSGSYIQRGSASAWTC